MRRQPETNVRAAWMTRYEDKLIELDQKLRGQVDWDTARHFYFSGYEPGAAAYEFISKRKT